VSPSEPAQMPTPPQNGNEGESIAGDEFMPIPLALLKCSSLAENCCLS
jgi:hypothetical protein